MKIDDEDLEKKVDEYLKEHPTDNRWDVYNKIRWEMYSLQIGKVENPCYEYIKKRRYR